MKKYILPVIILLTVNRCFAQDLAVKKNWLTESVVEVYHVLKPAKELKQGLYQALYNGRTPLASGDYSADRRTGTWHFYDTNGQLIQNFDYDTETILYDEPTTAFTKTKIAYGFDTTFKDSDRVSKPMKPGGRCFGYLNYIRLFRLSEDLYNINPLQFVAILEVLVSPGGRLADIKIHLKSDDFERITTFSPELIADDDKIFVPARLNNSPIMSRIFIRCRLTAYGQLDVD